MHATHRAVPTQLGNAGPKSFSGIPLAASRSRSLTLLGYMLRDTRNGSVPHAPAADQVRSARFGQVSAPAGPASRATCPRHAVPLRTARRREQQHQATPQTHHRIGKQRPPLPAPPQTPHHIRHQVSIDIDHDLTSRAQRTSAIVIWMRSSRPGKACLTIEVTPVISLPCASRARPQAE